MPDDQDLPHGVDIEFIGRHGSGMKGIVWQARQKQLGRTVAVKIIKPEWVNTADAIQHAKALARVDHPNVVSVYNVCLVKDPETDQEVPCVVLEWLPGPCLGDRLNGPRFTPEEADTICTQILNGLAAMHHHGVAHGDLHAGNVMFYPGGVKIIDIDYAESQSLARLAASSREAHVAGDVDFVRYLIRCVLAHAAAGMSAYAAAEPKLQAAESIPDVRGALAEYLRVVRLPQQAMPSGGKPSIPPLSGQLPGVYDLSSEAVTLLVRAARDSTGRITWIQDIRGDEILAGVTSFKPESARSMALWRQAIMTLVDGGYIESAGNGSLDNTYLVTAEGYNAADNFASILASQT